MTDANSNVKGKNISSQITLDELVAAIASLGDITKQLKDETWRFNEKTRSRDSLRREVIVKLKLDHNEKTRHSLYDFWHQKRHDIHKLTEKKKTVNDCYENDGNDGDIAGSENPSVPERNNSIYCSTDSLRSRIFSFRAIKRENSN